MHYAFSSAYSVQPETVAVAKPNPHAIPSENGDLDNEEYLHQWYTPKPSNKSSLTSQSIDDTPPSTRKVTWSSQTKQPDPYQHKKPAGFQLGMDLVYRDGQGKNLPVFCEGASADGLPHTVRLEYGTKLTFHDSNLQLLDQPNFSNIPKTPLDYRNEVGTGLSLEEAQALARPQTIPPVQQDLMSWHHQLYHLPYRILFRLASIGTLTKRLLECQNKTPLCVACQFGQAHRRL